MAFHEKAGRSQVGSVVFRWTRFFLPPSGHCRHASIRTLEERFVSLGACWAFSFQPVLPSDWRPVVLLFGVEPGPGHRRSHRNSALAFVLSLPGTVLTSFCFLFYAAAATVVRLLLCSGSYTSPLTHR